MATPLSSVIGYILNRRENFCCLCLNIIDEQAISVEDEVIVRSNQVNANVSVLEILTSLVGSEITEYLNTFKHVCTQCIQTAIQSYVFVDVIKCNLKLLTNSLNGLFYSVENSGECSDVFKSLFLSLNIEDFTSKQFYDMSRPLHNVTAASRRFRALLNTSQMKPKLEDEVYLVNIKVDEATRSKKKRIPIKTIEMLHNVKDPIIKCKECLKVYPTRLGLRSHYIRVHAPKIYNCNECQKKFGSPAFLEAHKSDSHCFLVCSDCGRTFNNKHTFKLHVEAHNLKVVCPDCGRVYKNKTTFRKHIEHNVCGQKTRASPANAKFTCDYCNKKYTQKVSLRVHIQYEHGNYKAHVCAVCNKKFWAQSRLKAHMVKHTKEKNFDCEVCHRKFVTKESLLYHTRIHTGDKPYECPHCFVRFLSASRRSQHVKRQHKDGTLHCDFCNCMFTTHTYLHKHRNKHIRGPEIKIVQTEKVNEAEFTKLRQELKRMESQEEDYIDSDSQCIAKQEYNIKFTENDEQYTVRIKVE